MSTDRPESRSNSIPRRHWLIAATASFPILRRPIGWTTSDDPGDAEILEVTEQAKALGLQGFESSTTAHYLGIGNASAGFREQALRLVEGLAVDFLEHFQAKGFPVEPPPGRLTVVILKDSGDLGRYLEIEEIGPVRGVYDLDTNRLAICDNRDDGGPRAARANSVALYHEATHQLTYNTGLLNRDGDVPLCISEGLAMYGEVRRPDGRTEVGAVNRERLAVLETLAKSGGSLIPTARLLVEDDLMQPGDPAVHAALAQSWLLIATLFKSPASSGRFRAYLEAIRPRRTSGSRLEDARRHLGDLADVDRDLRRAANRYLR